MIIVYEQFKYILYLSKIVNQNIFEKPFFSELIIFYYLVKYVIIFFIFILISKIKCHNIIIYF